MTQNPNHTATQLEPEDLQALMQAHLALIGPQAAFQAVQNLVFARYGLSPMDTLDLRSGAIIRVQPDPNPADKPQQEQP